ncbi:MAG: hypothetical protein ABIV50_01270 [Opitutus sp.]
MKQSPDELEKFVHEALRSLPDRKAPHSLELRVRAAIEARAAAPWWRQSFAEWPIVVRFAFVVVAVGLVKLALLATVWATVGVESTGVVTAVQSQFSWIDAIGGAIRGTGESFSAVLRSIPSLWLYGTLACVAGVYATLFSLGATAYRVLHTNR